MQIYANNQISVHQILFLLCFLCYCFSPSYALPSLQGSETLTKTGETQSGVVQTIQDTGEINPKKKVDSGKGVGMEKILGCDAECKVNNLIGLGMNKRIAGSLVYTCKIKALDPRHCVITGSSILKAESNLGNRCNGKNCFGMGGGAYKYKTYEEGVEDWVTRYNKYWYKAKSASFFYPSVGNKSPSRYCTSEESSGSDVGCPNGQKHAQSVWNKLEKSF